MGGGPGPVKKHFIVIIILYTPFMVPIMLKSTEGWDQVATFVALTMRRKMEIAWE